MRLAYLVSHPIQYHTPLLREIAQDPEIELKVFFCSPMGSVPFYDPEFQKEVDWGKELLEGYDHEFLPAISSNATTSLFAPFNYGMWSRLRAGKFDALWIHGYARPFHLLAALQAKLLGIKVLLRDDATLRSRKRAGWKESIKRVFFNMVRPLIDGVLSVGQMNSEYYRSYGFPEEKIFLLPYAVDNDHFQSAAGEAQKEREELRAALNLQPGKPVILFVGKLISEKAPQDLLAAFQLLSEDGSSPPSAYLLYVGDGALKGAIEKKVQELGWEDSVRLIGFINQSELPRYYDLANLFVLPSVAETWGLVVNEVMNAGRPVVVSSDVGCSVDLIEEGQNGYLFPPGDVEVLAEKLKMVLFDEDISSRMGKRSLEIINRHSFKANVSQLKECLRELTSQQEVAA